MTVRLASLHALTDRAMTPPQRPRQANRAGYHGCVIGLPFGENARRGPALFAGSWPFSPLRPPVLAVALS